MGLKARIMIARLSLLALFLCYYGSATFFVHSHLQNGVLVTHSHPFCNTSHKHTTQQALTIASLATLELEANASQIFIVATLECRSILYPPQPTFVSVNTTVSTQLRAPPFIAKLLIKQFQASIRNIQELLINS